MLFDSDVLIWALRNNARALDVIDAAERRLVSVVSRLELLQGVRDKKELALLKKFLQEFETVPLSESIGVCASDCMERVALKVHLSPIDALVGASALESKLPLCTGNVKHFRHIPDLVVAAFRP